VAAGAPRRAAARSIDDRLLDVLRISVLEEVLDRHANEQCRCGHRYGALRVAESTDCGREHLPAMHAGDFSIDDERRSDRDRPPEVRLNLRGNNRIAEQPVERTEDLVECGRQQSAMRKSGCPLVMLGDRECTRHPQAFPGGDPHVQPGRMVDAAAEAPSIVRWDVVARRWGMGRPVRDDRCRRRADRWHGADPTENDSGEARAISVAHMSEHSGFRERLIPPWWILAIGVALVGMVAVAYGTAISAPVGWLILAAGVGTVCWLLWTISPVIEVTESHLVAGRARLPRSSIAGAIALTGEQVRAERGPAADARRFILLRPWRASTGVLVTLDDGADPHPAWLLTSKDPDRLARALQCERRAFS
jgi:hypothetical protein